MHTHTDPSARPDTIVGISFDDTFRAQEFLTAAYRLASKGTLQLRDAVSVIKDSDGKTHVRETIDPQPLRSAVSGATWAGLFGLILGGPVGWVAGIAIGAGTGVARAKIIDLGVPDEWVAWFREAVQPNTFTVILLLGEFDTTKTVHELERFAGGHLVYANLAPDTLAQVRKALDDHEIVTTPIPDDAVPPSDSPTPPPHDDGPGGGGPSATAPVTELPPVVDDVPVDDVPAGALPAEPLPAQDH